MFGFLKKKLKESIEKFSGVAKKQEDVTVEKIEEESQKIIKEQKIQEEIQEKNELLEDSGIDPEKLKEVVEAPYKIDEIPTKPEEVIESIPSEKAVEEFEEKVERPLAEEHVKECDICKPEEVKELDIKEDSAVELPVEVSTEKTEEPVLETKLLPEEKPKKKSLFERLRKKKEQPKEEPKTEIVESSEKKPEVEEKIGLLEKLKKKISEKEIQEEDIKDVLWEMQVGLIESDVAVEVAEKITSDLKNALLGKSAKKKEIEKTVKESLEKSIFDIINVPSVDFIEETAKKKPFVVVFLGFNGSGKTTTIARIGHLLKQNNISCVLAAGDTWRAASIEQLEEHGRRLGINVIKHKYGSDPAAVIFDAVKHAKTQGIDVVLADTAGRSHANVNLVEELKKICRVNNPDMKILVVDALTGNDVVDQAKVFTDAVGVDGLILTKTDVYEKGGAILSSIHTIKKPILFLGVGQEYGDLEKFDPKKIVETLME